MTEAPSAIKPTVTERTERNFGLDLVRATAILMVFLAHTNPINPMNPAFPWFGWFGCGVEAFFVLSGFLIGRIVLRTLLEPGITWYSIWVFWVNRWLRTIPAYFAVLSVEYMFSGYVHRAFVYLFFGQNLVAPMLGFFTHSWSLAVEEWFYLLFPLCLFAIAVLLPGRQSGRIFFTGSCTFIFIGLLTKSGYWYLYQNDLIPGLIEQKVLLPSWKLMISPVGNWDEMRKMVVFRIDAIAYGCLAAYCMLRFQISKSARRIMLSMGLFCLAGCFLIVARTVASFTSDFVSDVLLLPLFCISFAFMLPAAVSCPRPGNMLNAVITNISKVSYSFYLLHYLIITQATDFYERHLSLPKWLIFVTTFALIYLLSIFMHRYVEAPFMAYRKNLFKRHKIQTHF